jgi:hypothetical protein
MPALFLEYSPGFTSSVMKIFTSTLTMAAPLFAVVRLATATATVFNCLVTHNSQGNLFVIQVQDIPDVSQSTICGQSALDIGHSAEAFSVNIVGGSDDDDDDDGDGVQCNTDDDAETMALSVTFDKQPPNVQLDALVDGITTAFGSQGVSFDPSVCDISSIPVVSILVQFRELNLIAWF